MLPLGADLEQYHGHYTLSKKDYYGILCIEHDANTEDIDTAFKELAKVIQRDIDQGDKYTEEHFKEVRRAHEVLTDPTRRAQYDEDLHVKAFHVSGESSASLNSEEARFEELRNWSYQEAEWQREKERAERRARNRARFEADEADADDREEDQSQAGLEVGEERRQAGEQERKRGVQAEKERRAEDERGRQRQVDDFRTAKLAAEARKVQADAEVQALREGREREAREGEGAGIERKKAADERGGKRKVGLAAERKSK